MAAHTAHGDPGNGGWQLADAPIDAGDLHAFAALQRAVTAVDPVPADLADRSRFAVAVEHMWAEVARIQRSPVGSLAGVRGDPPIGGETITFTMQAATVMVALDRTGRAGDRGLVRLDGWITPAGDHDVALRVPGETHQVVAIDGRFEFDGLTPGGLVQLVVTDANAPGGDPLLVTPAFQV